MISGLVNSGQKQISLKFSWLLPHAHKMAAIAPDITSSCDNPPFPSCFWTLSSLMSHWLKLGHMSACKPIIGRGDWDVHNWFGLFLVLCWS